MKPVRSKNIASYFKNIKTNQKEANEVWEVMIQYNKLIQKYKFDSLSHSNSRSLLTYNNNIGSKLIKILK